MNDRDFHDQVYGADNPKTESGGWIQWKGTNVCMDVHCVCGRDGHVDEEFFYFYECECGAKYAVGQNVKLIPLNDEQAAHAAEGVGFKQGNEGSFLDGDTDQ